jgi:hypothetical protein
MLLIKLIGFHFARHAHFPTQKLGGHIRREAKKILLTAGVTNI